MEGIQLLTKMKATTPKMIKLIVTGYPALQNAIEAVNRGADAYVLKPVKMKDVLKILKEHLEKQRTEKKINEEKVVDFIKKRAKEITKGKIE
jgi:DNA-binding NtrC family response regulator